MVSVQSKDIVGFEDKYRIFSDGRIYSLPRFDKMGRSFGGIWLKFTLDKNGYRRVGLISEQRKSNVYRVARLVALHFLIQPEGKFFVNHKDGNKENDDVSNLEWVTSKENTIHAWENGLCKPYDRKQLYNRQGIIDSNKQRSKKNKND